MNELSNQKMSESRFWELVEMAHWPCDYDQMKIKYLKILSKEECENFRHMISAAYGLLENVSNDLEMPVGDDSYSDLLNHIIGLGKEEYYKHLKNPKRIVKRAEDNTYEESFIYCVPHKDDYGEKSQYSFSHVKNIAKSSLKEIDTFRKMDNGQVKWLSPIQKEMDDIEMLMQNFLDNPTEDGLEGLVSGKTWVDKACKKIDKFFEKNEMELPRKFTEPRPSGSFHGMCTALFGNTVYDAERLIEYLKEEF